jgi:hypothetical protein
MTDSRTDRSEPHLPGEFLRLSIAAFDSDWRKAASCTTRSMAMPARPRQADQPASCVPATSARRTFEQMTCRTACLTTVNPNPRKVKDAPAPSRRHQAALFVGHTAGNKTASINRLTSAKIVIEPALAAC